MSACCPHQRPIGSRRLTKLGALLLLAVLGGCPFAPPSPNPGMSMGTAVVLGYNDLGMHCMNQDFSELMVLPPYNTLHAQVIARNGEHPTILSSGVSVEYSVPGNTTSTTKTNFWTYAKALLGADPAPDVGLTGNGLSGTMTPTSDNDWSAIGIPLTQVPDTGGSNPYQLASITVRQHGTIIATTSAVVPVSWEMNCNLCHNTSGVSTATDILQKHDLLHATDLVNSKPVLCARCHADPALNLPGTAGLPTLSSAMHTSHAPRMAAVSLTSECYACHPGVQTQCLRDVHFSRGMTCDSCHVSMAAVGNPSRRPWVDEPRCGSAGCHAVAGHDYEQADTLFRNSKGHGSVHCEACHGSPHAITPTVVAADNAQAIALQGHAGTIDTCTVCHTQHLDDSFFHRVGEGD